MTTSSPNQQSGATCTEPTIQSSFPTWFQNLQEAAQTTYENLPRPSRKNETWRFGNLKQLDFSDFRPAYEVDAGDIDVNIDGLETTSAQFVFANDDLVHAESDLPAGVICLPLADALIEHSDLVQQYLLKQEAKLGSAKYAALHTANLSNGLFVYVPKGIEVEHPIEAYHIVAGDHASIFPHTLIITEEHAKVSVVDYFISADNSTCLVVAMNDLISNDGSALNYVAVQNLNTTSKIIQIGSTNVNRDARAKSFVANLGAAWARNESYSTLNAPGAHSDMLSLNVPTGSQEYDQRTFQHHAAPHTYSDLLYKNALYGNGKTIFAGLINVDLGAHFTDAYQTCRNLMMSDNTEAHSMPGLQIHADQVKCSHGSTASAISDEEIFYLQARGIKADTARQLIARGFCIQVIERLEHPELEALVLRYLDAKFMNA